MKVDINNIDVSEIVFELRRIADILQMFADISNPVLTATPDMVDDKVEDRIFYPDERASIVSERIDAIKSRR